MLLIFGHHVQKKMTAVGLDYIKSLLEFDTLRLFKSYNVMFFSLFLVTYPLIIIQIVLGSLGVLCPWLLVLAVKNLPNKLL